MRSKAWSALSRTALFPFVSWVFIFGGLQACATAEDVARKYRDQDRQELERQKYERIPRSNMKNPGAREYPPAYVPRTAIPPPYPPTVTRPPTVPYPPGKPPPGYPGSRAQSLTPKDKPPKLGAGIRPPDDYRDTNGRSSGGGSRGGGY